jgi:hypothetical protein
MRSCTSARRTQRRAHFHSALIRRSLCKGTHCFAARPKRSPRSRAHFSSVLPRRSPRKAARMHMTRRQHRPQNAQLHVGSQDAEACSLSLGASEALPLQGHSLSCSAPALPRRSLCKGTHFCAARPKRSPRSRAHFSSVLPRRSPRKAAREHVTPTAVDHIAVHDSASSLLCHHRCCNRQRPLHHSCSSMDTPTSPSSSATTAWPCMRIPAAVYHCDAGSTRRSFTGHGSDRFTALSKSPGRAVYAYATLARRRDRSVLTALLTALFTFPSRHRCHESRCLHTHAHETRCRRRTRSSRRRSCPTSTVLRLALHAGHTMPMSAAVAPTHHFQPWLLHDSADLPPRGCSERRRRYLTRDN